MVHNLTVGALCDVCDPSFMSISYNEQFFGIRNKYWIVFCYYDVKKLQQTYLELFADVVSITVIMLLRRLTGVDALPESNLTDCHNMWLSCKFLLLVLVCLVFCQSYHIKKDQLLCTCVRACLNVFSLEKQV